MHAAAENPLATECLAFANVPEERTTRKLPAGRSSPHPIAGVETTRASRTGAGGTSTDVRDQLPGHDVRPDSQIPYPRRALLTLSRIVSGDGLARVFEECDGASARLPCGLIMVLRDCGAAPAGGL